MYKPIYLVSPELLVTSEHIISESASTSSSSSSFSSLCSGVMDIRFSASLSLIGSGDVNELRGVEAFPSCPEVACDGDVGFDIA